MSGRGGAVRVALRDVPLIARLALADTRRDLFQSICLALAIAAVAAPVLALLGLRNGLIETLRTEMIEDPYFRELKPTVSDPRDDAFFAALRARPDVAFVTPSILEGALPVTVAGADGAQAQADMTPSGPGDPLLAAYGLDPPREGEVVVSDALAERAGLAAGRDAALLIRARIDGVAHEQTAPVRIAGVLPRRAEPRPAVFVPADFAADVGRFREGRGAPGRGWPGRPAVVPPGFDGAAVVSDAPLPEAQLLLALINTGFTEILPLSAEAFRARFGIAPPRGAALAEVRAVGRAAGAEAVEELASNLRPRGAVALPFAELGALSFVGPGGEAHTAPLAALSPAAGLRERLGVNPPWSAAGVPRDGAEGAPVLVPEAWGFAPGDALVLRLEAAHGGPLEIGLTVAGAAPGDMPVAPVLLAGRLRTALDRPVRRIEDGALELLPRGQGGFRLYARSIDDVPVLADALAEMGAPVRSRRDRIERTQRLDRALGGLFAIIAGVGAAGGLLAVGASAIASVQRKTADLAMLRLLGFGRGALFAFPLARAAVISLAAIAIAFAAYGMVERIIDTRLAPAIGVGMDLCRLTPRGAALAVLAILALSCGASLVAAAAAMRVEPRESLRAD